MNHFQYLALLGACVLLTLPLEIVIGARVWRSPARLARALVPPLIVFGAWDFVATAAGQWSFNRAYSTSLRLPPGVPFEEILFFVAVPVCALLTLEAVRALRAPQK